jgi:nuclear pore complex protein Nup62
MDEIITRWATDLTKYQKEFREQAEKVAEWDRMIVENGSRVQKLYGSTVDAERATQEIERQLASVEGQQDELSSWLDRYEREVDEMMSKQVGPGESLQGPDQERERTYVPAFITQYSPFSLLILLLTDWLATNLPRNFPNV